MITVITPLRGCDAQGNGAYGAPRGTRTHKGEDVCAWVGSLVVPEEGGTITKIGFPYSPEDEEKCHLRYVELLTQMNYRIRYFYVDPLVEVGDYVQACQPIGAVQDLQAVYGSTMENHVHVEVINPDGVHIDPKHYF